MQTSTPDRAYQLFVGIDVSAATGTVAWMPPTARPSRALTIPQTASGYAVLQQQLRAAGSEPEATFVVLETTGSYWITLG